MNKVPGAGTDAGNLFFTVISRMVLGPHASSHLMGIGDTLPTG